ncbi:uncharacterized protein AB9W97_012551 isoform 1-T2 [Spinachia spinachia]
MATVVPFASCYGSVRPLKLFGRGPGQANYLLLFTQKGPCFAPRPRLALLAPRMSLRQIWRMLKMMKQVRSGDAAAAAPAIRKQGPVAPAPTSPGTKSEKKCTPSCIGHKCSIKRVP